MMAIRHWMTAGALAAAAMTVQPAVAYEIQPTGHTLASPRLVVDVVDRISRYSKATDGCAFVFSVNMAVLPRGARAVQPTVAVLPLGGHYEQWTVNACAAKQVFQVAMWPSLDGGSDFAITPLTGRMPLYSR